MSVSDSVRPQQASDFVTVEQLIEQRPFLTERKVRQIVAERQVPFYKPGKRLLFDLRDIDDWVKRSRVEPAR